MASLTFKSHVCPAGSINFNEKHRVAFCAPFQSPGLESVLMPRDHGQHMDKTRAGQSSQHVETYNDYSREGWLSGSCLLSE